MTDRDHPFDGPEVFDDAPQLEEYTGPRVPKSSIVVSVVRGINIRNMVKRMERLQA